MLKYSSEARRTSSSSVAELSEDKKQRMNVGRPILHSEGWSKVTVVLLDRQVAHLDRLAADIRQNTGRAISRAEILRALIEFTSRSGADLTTATSEEEIVSRLLDNKSKKRE